MTTDGIVSLRAIEPCDIDIILGWENDTREWTASTTAAPFSRRIIEEYVLTYDADPFSARQLRLMVEAQGRTVGAVDIFDFDPVNRRAGIGVVIDRGDRRHGYALRALRLLELYCHRRLGMHQLWAVTAEANHAARQLLLSAGYGCTGRMNDWLCDGKSYAATLFYQRILPSGN